MELINEKDETVMSIWGVKPWCFELDPASGEPNENCAVAELGRSGYTSTSLASVGERDVPPLEYLYRSVYPKGTTGYK